MPVLDISRALPLQIQTAWDQWQAREEVTSFLSEPLRAYGYTVLYVPPQSRGVFLDLLPLLIVLAEVAEQPQARTRLRLFWVGWHAWLPRLTAYLRRLAQDKPATFPPFPPQEPR